MKKQPERTAATRNNFINTFIEINQQKPIEKITISEITNKAGYNRSTFYQYFNDAYHLLSCIEDDLLSYINDTIVKQIGKEKTDSLFIELFMSIYSEKRKILKVLLANNSYSNFPSRLKESLIPVFAVQMNLSLDNERNAFILDFYLAGIISILARWVSSDDPIPPQQYALLIKEIVEGMKKSELFPVF